MFSSKIQMMKDVCKEPKNSLFWIIKIDLFDIWNPDGVGVKDKVRKTDIVSSWRLRW